MTNWNEHRELQKALQDYLLDHEIELRGTETYESGIDCVFVCIEGDPVLIIGLPPVSNYTVNETEFTNKYLRTGKLVAV